MYSSGQAWRGGAFRTPPGSKDSNGKEVSPGAAGVLPGYFFLFYNPPMSSKNWIKIVIAIIAGIAFGIIYGLVIDPVEYTDATPDNLSEDYRTDYILMVAEAYQSERDSSLAAQRLAMLGSDPPVQIVNNAIEYAQTQGFAQDDITLLQELLTAMQTYQPAGNTIP